jgi:hypothetical protein
MFHDLSVNVPGIGGNLDKQLPSPSKTVKDLEMYLTELGLEISAGGVTTLVPMANVKIAVYDKNSK